MSMKLFPLFACSLVFVLTSCGGIRNYLHPESARTAEGGLVPVELVVGQEVKVLKHTQGIAIVGGYKAGLRVADPSIAEVRYGDGSEEDSMAPNVYLTGGKQGETRACYVNRYGGEADFLDRRNSFSIIVK